VVTEDQTGGQPVEDDDVDHDLIEEVHTPLEDQQPVDLEEVDEDPMDHQPPEEWGQNGQGEDDGSGLSESERAGLEDGSS
jgi:hypothetical protein